ncbi:diacylglycerol kinase [Desulfobacter postgatei]|uniref:Diacylglycerol kinase n=1 Tax=Desulfobacter postgatei 2ac9 TaxID=879212 RepID=I5B5C2_9BACT|nr:diacylglycerol kinase [Desulfobacter postgatei]EIM64685.1 diacylglycerol kinase [Desulfobacter postgatei 2ac9]
MRNKFLGTGEPGYNPLRKMRVILAGLRFVFRYELTVAYKLVLSTIILILAFIFRQWLDFEIILLATGLVVVTEMLNTAIEAICDFVEIRENEKIKAIKDVGAAAVGISILIWLVVMIFNGAHLISIICGYNIEYVIANNIATFS